MHCRATLRILRRWASPRRPNCKRRSAQSKRIVIDRLDCEHFTRLEDWFTPEMKEKYEGSGLHCGAAKGNAGRSARPRLAR